MIKAYCPAHITCFFRPTESSDVLSKGSLGAGIRLESGTIVSMEERVGNTRILLNGVPADAKITQFVLEKTIPEKGVELNIETQLPFGQGFGMSASGAIAAALCASEISGADRYDSFVAAHIADIEGGGGLGDVAALMTEAHQPVRLKAGIPPKGVIIDTRLSFDRVTVVVLGLNMKTSDILKDSSKYNAIMSAGGSTVTDYMKDVTKERLFDISNRFSTISGVEQNNVSDAIGKLKEKGIRSAMCMLGNSIFSEASEDEIKEVLGEDIWTFSTRSTNESARIIRKE
jgi:Predicted archaeal kinase (sugar kinase superfamily)